MTTENAAIYNELLMFHRKCVCGGTGETYTRTDGIKRNCDCCVNLRNVILHYEPDSIKNKKQLDLAQSIIDSWPKWKQQMVKDHLDNSPTRRTPRKPILGEDDGY